jgi:hypothetical protein
MPIRFGVQARTPICFGVQSCTPICAWRARGGLACNYQPLDLRDCCSEIQFKVEVEARSLPFSPSISRFLIVALRFLFIYWNMHLY